MGRIVSNFFMSLDGVVEAPDQWHMPYFNDEMGAAIGRGMETNAAFLMGRVLYEEWAAFWPQQSDDDPLAAFFKQPAEVRGLQLARDGDLEQHDHRRGRRPTPASGAQAPRRR